MQKSLDFHLDTFIIEDEASLSHILFSFSPGDRIGFIGDLGSGKTTYIRALLRHNLDNDSLIVRSPTYTYYQKYEKNSVEKDKSTLGNEIGRNSRDASEFTIYHFDLYRLKSKEDFFFIGGGDIFENPDSICLVEWPEILGDDEIWTKKVFLKKKEDGIREVQIMSYR